MQPCNKCGKVPQDGWYSKSGYCRECAAEVLKETKGKAPLYRKWWFWLIVLFSLAALRAITSGATQPEPAGYFKADGSLKNTTQADFTFIAQKAVKSYLKAPETAEFEALHDQWYTYDEADVFALSGTFTAQNAFGVPTEETFFVKFWYGGDYKNYEIRAVAIGDDVMYETE